MDLLTNSPSQSQQFTTALMSCNLMSFDSPSTSNGTNVADQMLVPEKDFLKPKPSNIQLPIASPCMPGSATSTPFEGDLVSPKFTFESALGDIAEDPFDLVERNAVQNANDANDPFELVMAEAAVPKKPSFAETSGSSKGSFLNQAFGEDSSTGLTADFDQLKISSRSLNITDGRIEKSASEAPEKKKFVATGDSIENEIPPWESQLINFDEPNAVDSDGENELIDVMRRVSSEFPKVAASIIDDLDTEIVKELKLKTPVLMPVTEFDLSPAAEQLEIPNVGLRSVDLSFMETDTAKIVTPAKQQEESLDEWKRQILEKASAFSMPKKFCASSAKPLSMPLSSFNLNSPVTGAKVLTPMKSIGTPKSNLPTPQFKSRLMKPRLYAVNKENM